MPSRRVEFARRAVRWLGPAAVLAAAPKCMLCVLAYAGLGTALGLGGPEICGATADASAPLPAALAGCGLAGGLILLGLQVRRVRRRSAPSKPVECHPAPRWRYSGISGSTKCASWISDSCQPR